MNKIYFEGWYYKHQSLNTTLAVIPGRAKDCAFIQVITDACSYHIPYPLTQYKREKDSLLVGSNVFSASGIHLDIQTQKLTLNGELHYQNLVPIRSDIMGPFRFFPMECRHGVISMRHTLSGLVEMNGQTHNFSGGVGYIESDCGRSFPKNYMWVQANDFNRDCSIMASVASIPVLGLHFCGCICVIWLEGREYRLATYHGVKVIDCEPDFLSLRQGRYQLDIRINKNEGRALKAPMCGYMDRTIRETAACAAHFRFSCGKTILFEEESARTSHEYVPES